MIHRCITAQFNRKTEIPGLLIGSDDANTIKTFLGNGVNVTAYLDEANRGYGPLYRFVVFFFLCLCVVNQFFSGPDGWYILDISDPHEVTVVNQTRQFFDYAHNILIGSFSTATVVQ